MQRVYKGMDIGMANACSRARIVPHWGFIRKPGEAYSGVAVQEYARTCFADIDARGQATVLAGGTGFYVRAAIDDRFRVGRAGRQTRARVGRVFAEHGSQALWMHSTRHVSKALPSTPSAWCARSGDTRLDGVCYASQHEGLATLGRRCLRSFRALSTLSF